MLLHFEPCERSGFVVYVVFRGDVREGEATANRAPTVESPNWSSLQVSINHRSDLNRSWLYRSEQFS